MAAQFQRLLKELAYLKAEVKKAQFAVELSRIRDVVRMLEDHFDQVVEETIRACQVEDLPMEEYTEVVIDNRELDKTPYYVGQNLYFLNQNILTISGHVGPQIREQFLGACKGKSVNGSWRDNIRIYLHNRLLSMVMDEIMYYNRKYQLALEIRDFTLKTLSLTPPVSVGNTKDYARAKLIFRGCNVCGMNMPVGAKGKCNKCKGKPRSKANICPLCNKWGFLGDQGHCQTCKSHGCCTIM